MRDGQYSHDGALNFIEDCIWKVAEAMPPDPILVSRPYQRIDSKLIDCLKRRYSESIRCNGAALEIPEKRCPDFCLRLGQDLDTKLSHRALSRALASAQESALTLPARRAACRVLISWFQA